MTKENKVCKKYIFVPGVIAAKSLWKMVFQSKSFTSLVSKLTEICFKKIYISISWRVIGNFYWKFQGGGGLKGQTLLKFSEELKVSIQISLGVGGVWTFSGMTQ